MHRAPAVSFLVERSRWHARASATLALAALACNASLALLQPLSTAVLLVLAMLTLACAGLALHGWRHSATGVLHWDGQAWHWNDSAQSAPGCPALHLDFQYLMLVTVRDALGKKVWLWLEPQHSPRRNDWLDIRRALFAWRGQTTAASLDGQPQDGVVDA